jgi:hypothetical protein
MENFLKISELVEGLYYKCGLSEQKVLVTHIDIEREQASGKIFFEGEFKNISIHDNQLMLWNTQ